MTRAQLVQRVFNDLDLGVVRQRWARDSIYIKAPPERIPELTRHPMFANLEAALTAISKHRDAVSMYPNVDELETSRYESQVVNVSEAAAACRSGMTLNVTRFADVLPVAQQFARELALTLGLPEQCVSESNLFVSSEGYGSPMHFDGNETLVIQICGAKLWRYGANLAEAAPLGDSELFPDDFAYAPHEVEMTPGDVLCLPRGYWHATRGTAGDSMSLSFFLRTPSPLALLARFSGFRQVFPIEELGDWRGYVRRLIDEIPDGASSSRDEGHAARRPPNYDKAPTSYQYVGAEVQSRSDCEVWRGSGAELALPNELQPALRWVASRRKPFTLDDVEGVWRRYCSTKRAVPDQIRWMAVLAALTEIGIIRKVPQ